MSSTGWRVGDVIQIADWVGLVGDVTPEELALGYWQKQDPIFKGNLVTSDPEYLIGLLGLEEEEE